ncbi:ArsR family transcriptional regulator [Actinotalea ferrariae CF5-4]|uniref:ArsR family transcriptional regulator n=1 Tax=Actinotalea ferrariae CF5-4 TaxID=948458 RepID=A0A021VQ90_9CELL|nr:helix-turn-helix domain-containing protein [Actinotalea ferrariae]EYR62215.1 ArsR family transcriptional regulator [Actinotalea ferrariae CF5-4]
MALTPADVVLHPVRLRIAQAFLGGRELTTSDLRGELAEVPAATLYRQVAALVDGGVLEVAAEQRVRGAVERTYRLREGAASVDADAAARMSLDDHRQAFLVFALGLLGEYDRYLATGDVDLARDRVGYRSNALHLSDDELDEMVAALREVVLPRLAHEPAPGRRRRLLSTVLLPGDHPASGSPAEGPTT